MRQVVEDNWDNKSEILQKLLLDKNKSIRELSRFYLTKLGVGAFDEYYKNALKLNILPHLVEGLGEVIHAENLEECIFPYLNSDSAKVHKAAIKSIAFSERKEEYRDIFFENIVGKPLPVALESARQLFDLATINDFALLLKLFEQEDREAVLVRILRVTRCFSYWDRYSSLLKMIGTNLTKNALVESEIILGAHTSFLEPREVVKREILQLLENKKISRQISESIRSDIWRFN